MRYATESITFDLILYIIDANKFYFSYDMYHQGKYLDRMIIGLVD